MRLGPSQQILKRTVCLKLPLIFVKLTVRQIGPIHNSLENIYFFFLFALSKFSFTLNFTILLIKSNGIGLSNGNFTVPFPPS